MTYKEEDQKQPNTSTGAAITCFVIGLAGFGLCCFLLGKGLGSQDLSEAIPWMLASAFVGVVTAFAIGLIDREQAEIRYERHLKAETAYEIATAKIQPPQLPAPLSTNIQRPMSLPEPTRLISAGTNQFVAVTPTDDQRIEELARSILMRCYSANPSQANIEARIQMKPDGLLRSHSDITLAMQKLFAQGWVSKESSAKTARWLWRDKQNGNQLMDFDRPTTSLPRN